MTTHTVWVGGTHPYSRSYAGEYGAMKLTEEQIHRWLPGYLEDAGYDLDAEAIAENMSREWDTSTGYGDLPTWSDVSEWCLGSGAYTDQTFGVEVDDELVWSGGLEDLATDDELGRPRLTTTLVDEHLEGVWLVYSYCEKGGWSAEFDVPEGETFDPEKLAFYELEVCSLGSVITGISYNGEQLDVDCDSDGKGNDYYLVVDGEFYTLA